MQTHPSADGRPGSKRAVPSRPPGRPSATGEKFLIVRPDSGKYVYQRKVPDKLRPFMVGPIFLGWKTGFHDLKSPATIKIALSTGDPATAEKRRDKVHSQVEELIEQAEARLNTVNKAHLAQQVGTLRNEDVHRMAGQLRHDILGADDRLLTRPKEQSEIGWVLGQLLHSDPRPSLAVAGTEQHAQDVQRRHAKHLLAQRNLSRYDQAITEGEIDADPDVIENLLELVRRKDACGTKLDPTTFAALQKPPREANVIPSDVSAALADNGLAMSDNHPDRGDLQLALLRAKVDAHRIVEARRHGDTTLTPSRPMRETPAPAGETLSEMRDKWIGLMKPARKAKDDNHLYLQAFIGRYGDLPVTSVTRKMIRDFRDTLQRRPRNMPADIRALPLVDQVAWGETRQDCRCLTPNTVNAKGIGTLSAIMEAAIKDDLIDKNPCAGLLLPVKGNAEDRLPYSLADLNKIFSSPIYANGKRWKAGCGDAAFWIPLIGLLAGPRLEEIGQLLLADIHCEDDIWYFDFIDIDNEAETAGRKPQDKKIKTKASRRKVPIHSLLIALGFLRYVAAMKRDGFKHLFPGLTEYRGRRTKDWSKWWGRFTHRHVTQSSRKVFHSFRHVFQERMRSIAKGNEDVVKALSGHKKHMYGAAIDLKTRAEYIEKLEFPGLDFKNVREEAKRLYFL